MSDSIFKSLVSYIPSDKRNPREDYLTQMFAWLLNNIPDYAVEYIRFLSSRMEPVIEEFDDSNISVETQFAIPSGKIDMVIFVNN